MAAYRRVCDSRHLQGPDLIPVFGSLSVQDLYIADVEHCLSVCLSVTHSWSTWQPVWPPRTSTSPIWSTVCPSVCLLHTVGVPGSPCDRPIPLHRRSGALSVRLSVCYTQLEYLAARVTAQDLYIADLEHCVRELQRVIARFREAACATDFAPARLLPDDLCDVLVPQPPPQQHSASSPPRTGPAQHAAASERSTHTS